MRTLARFELALGRRVNWGFDGHQLKVAPHAFADANAFYRARDAALVFGYFPAQDGGMVFSCLSHDVVAHETTHALVDGLRQRFTDPSSPDQAAFHEGFADVVALLSMFSLGGVVERLIDRGTPRGLSAVRRERLIVNRSAVKNLLGMKARHAYVSHGSKSGLESVLPGVRITVLGPPTLQQSNEIRKERSKDAAEFWMLQANAARLVATDAPALRADSDFFSTQTLRGHEIKQVFSITL